MQKENQQYQLRRSGETVDNFDVFKVEHDVDEAKSTTRFMRADHFWYWRADSPWNEDGAPKSEDTWNIIRDEKGLLQNSEMAEWDPEKLWCRAITAIQHSYEGIFSYVTAFSF